MWYARKGIEIKIRTARNSKLMGNMDESKWRVNISAMCIMSGGTVLKEEVENNSQG